MAKLKWEINSTGVQRDRGRRTGKSSRRNKFQFSSIQVLHKLKLRGGRGGQILTKSACVIIERPLTMIPKSCVIISL